MKKSLRITLAVSMIVFALAVNVVPAIWDLNYLPGWPRFLSELALPLSFYGAVLMYVLSSKNTTKKSKWIVSIVCLVLLLCNVGLRISSGFKYFKVAGYIHSPNGVNTAVVLESAAKLSEVRPLRARYFYVYQTRGGVYLEETLEQAAYIWTDENTLVFIEGYRENVNDFDTGERYTTKELHW